jgi:hypothetical protein
MKVLMLAIKAHLQADITLGYIPDMSIFITPDEQLIPESVNLPAISIKDGSIKNDQKLCKNYIQYATVKVTVYQRILKQEESITGTNGVLDMAADVTTSLIDEKFSIAGLQNVFPVGEGESQIMGRENEMMQMKTIVFQYTRHITWA